MRFATTRARLCATVATLAAAALWQGCDQTPTAVGAGADASFGGSTSGTLTSSTTPSVNTSVTAFSSAASVKVVFNKASFFTNNNPNPFGCAGDARTYYDPQSDRAVPVGPAWLRNVSLDITNSNAQGASQAIGCSVTGSAAAPASNCASFDDLQPLNGLNPSAVVVGGFGCTFGVANCVPNALTSDIWTMSAADISTLAGWSEANIGLPPITPPANTNPLAAGYAFQGGDYDAIHNSYYLYGGVTPSTTDPTAPGIFSNSVVQLNLESNGQVSTVYPPISITNPTTNLPAPNFSGRHFYAGWAKSGGFDNALTSVLPPAMVGPTFTWGMRRDATTKSTCLLNDNPASFGPGVTCTMPTTFSSFNSGTAGTPVKLGTPVSLKPAVSTNDDNDYYLLLGGMQTNGVFNTKIYLYKPHGYSVDVSTSGTPLPASGDWMLMSNVTANPGTISGSVMSIVDVGMGPSSASGSAGPSSVVSLPYIGTPVGGTRQAGDLFAGWLGRGFHGTSYDPGQNRFYIFGGLENPDANIGSPLPATAVVPNLAANDVWIYDPPALGRRPNSLCWTNQMPDSVGLPSPLNQFGTGKSEQPFGNGQSSFATVSGANANLDANANYLRAPFVFPPGGCMQRYKLDNLSSAQLPPQRFAHGQVFDPDNKLVYVFGGCSAPNVIHGSGAPNAGDPVHGCPGTALRNDLWVYSPPIVREIVPQAYSTTALAAAVAGPYNPLTLLSEPTNTDLWLDHLPFTQDNEPTNPAISVPAPFEALGNWIPLFPGGSPTLPFPRAAAMVTWDEAHGRIYVQGGYGCIDSACAAPPQALNDLWVYQPPVFQTVCPTFRELGSCGTQAGLNQGTWTQLIPNTPASAVAQPTQRYGGTSAFTYNLATYGDEFYTVTNSACAGQGPIQSSDATESGGYVGAIYVDVDRTQMSSASNLVINLRLLPFDQNTKLPAYNNGGIPNSLVNVYDSASSTDTAVLRVQLMNDPLNSASNIQSSLQPRYHEFLTGSATLGDTVYYAAGPVGVLSEKQILIPLNMNSSINMIKIERVSGSMKFYEMTVSLF